MKASNLIAFAVGAGLCTALYACGGGGSSGSASMAPVQPSQPTPMIFSVNDVLGRAKVRSETDDPFTVNGTSLNPTNDESSDPVSID
jgi:hypothetical protein